MSGFGAFGKIPELGDFFRHNLTPGFLKAWDGWLQETLAGSRAALGGAWEEAYMSAPIWRFSLPPGMAGEQGMSGILMASVDRVGRAYPLTLAAPHPPGASAAAIHFANGPLFEQLEDIALQTLDVGGTRDAMLAALEGHAVAPAPRPLTLPYTGTRAPEARLAAQAAEIVLGRRAVWSAMMEGDHRLMATDTLPKGREGRALFDLSDGYWGGAPQHAAALLPDPAPLGAPQYAEAEEDEATMPPTPLPNHKVDRSAVLATDKTSDPLADILGADRTLPPEQ